MLYTGQQRETADGVYYYGARFYNADIGRFLQPDTIVPEPGNPQDLNRYSYVRNNPVNHSDPTGHCMPDINCPGDDNRCQGGGPGICDPAPAGGGGNGSGTGSAPCCSSSVVECPASTCALHWPVYSGEVGLQPYPQQGRGFGGLFGQLAGLIAAWQLGQMVGERVFDKASEGATTGEPHTYLFHYTDRESAKKIILSGGYTGWGELRSPSGVNFLTPDVYLLGADAKERLAIASRDPVVPRVVDTMIVVDATASGIGGQYQTVTPKLDAALNRVLTGRGLELRMIGPVRIRIEAVVLIPSSEGMK